MSTQNPNLKALSEAGVSIWLDDLNRPLITSGDLQELIDTKAVVGVTTNPSIFAAALSEGDAYNAQVKDLAQDGKDVDEAVFALTTDDVRNACDIMLPLYEATGGQDGRVSIEVDPRLAADTHKTVEEAKTLRAAVDRPNVHIKIPATVEGLPAISQVLAEGISVNVTLIFSLDRYRGVMNAFLTGLEQARQAGKDLSKIHSVASFFVSRVDTEIDKRLDKIGTDEAKALKGKAGVANARLAYQAYEEVFSTPRWQVLEAEGAHKQRPLWASTGVKDPAYRDTMYVDDLVAPNTVNTMPAKTLEAVADHGDIQGDQVTGNYDDAKDLLDSLERLGVSYADVVGRPRARGRRQVREVLGRAADRRPGGAHQGRDRRLVRRGGQVTHVALGVVAAGPAADAIAQHVPTLVGDRFASRLFAQDATLWGPEAEAESAIRLSWTGLPRSSRPLVGEVSALREHLREQGLDHVVLCGHGRLVAGPRGHLRHGRGGPDGPGLLRPRLRAGRPGRPAGAHRRGGLQQVRVDRRDRLPAPRLRGGVHRRPASTRPRASSW